MKREFEFPVFETFSQLDGGTNLAVEFTRGRIFYHNKHTHYVVLRNSSNICIFYKGKLLFSLPEVGRWDIANAAAEYDDGFQEERASSPSSDVVQLGFKRDGGRPFLLFLGYNRQTRDLELISCDVWESTWEACSMGNLNAICSIKVFI